MFDDNTSGKINSPFLKFPDMCRRGLRRLPLEMAPMHVYVRRAHFTTKSRFEIVVLLSFA